MTTAERIRKALAGTARQLHWSYIRHRKWAQEARSKGNELQYHEHAAKALRARDDAWSHLNSARGW